MIRCLTTASLYLLLASTCGAQTFDKDLAKLINERETQMAALNAKFLEDVESLKVSSTEKLRPNFEDAMKALDFDRSKEIKAQIEAIEKKQVELWTGRTMFAQNYDPNDQNYSLYIRMPRGVWIQLLPEHLFRFQELRNDKSTIEFAHKNGSTVRVRGKNIEHKNANIEKKYTDGGQITWLTDVLIDGVLQAASR